ncbi:hypothetical protein DAMA08_016340 [Martiniozyma asiatica (nom. inval.)]|nr:hypothetical protein DAMA08_016340 [Martiniozyma asiatica]
MNIFATPILRHTYFRYIFRQQRRICNTKQESRIIIYKSAKLQDHESTSSFLDELMKLPDGIQQSKKFLRSICLSQNEDRYSIQLRQMSTFKSQQKGDDLGAQNSPVLSLHQLLKKSKWLRNYSDDYGRWLQLIRVVSQLQEDPLTNPKKCTSVVLLSGFNKENIRHQLANTENINQLIKFVQVRGWGGIAKLLRRFHQKITSTTDIRLS